MFAQLKPVELDNLTEETHQRRRAADLARALQSSPARSRARDRSPYQPWRLWMSRRKPIFFITSTVAAGVAAAAIVIPGALRDSPPPGSPPSTAQSHGAGDSGHLAAREFLLAAAATTMKEPAESGRYWYDKSQWVGQIRWSQETNQETSDLLSEAVEKAEKISGKPEEVKALFDEYGQKIRKARAEGKLPFSVSRVTPAEGWYARDTKEISRYTEYPDTKITFASPADEEKWKGMGSPKLFADPTGTWDKPVTVEKRNVTNPSEWFPDGEQLAMPTDKPGLEKWLREKYEKEGDGAAVWSVVGDNPAARANMKGSYTEWLFNASSVLLVGPLQQGTRAALFQILAEQPGITSSGQVTDSLGRTGVALTMTGVDAPDTSISENVGLQVGERAEFRLIIDEKTAELLAFEIRPVGQSTPILQSTYENFGWVDKLGDIPQK
jgi:hypothetical protein